MFFVLLKDPLAAQKAECWSDVSPCRALAWCWDTVHRGRERGRSSKKLKDFPSQKYQVQKTLEVLQSRRVRLDPHTQSRFVLYRETFPWAQCVWDLFQSLWCFQSTNQNIIITQNVFPVGHDMFCSRPQEVSDAPNPLMPPWSAEPWKGSFPMALQIVLWSRWKDFLTGNTNLLTTHPDLATLNIIPFLCMFQQPGQVRNSWEVQSYRIQALLWKGEEVLCPWWSAGTLSWMPAVSKMWQLGLVWKCLLCSVSYISPSHLSFALPGESVSATK